mgnify:CR=1 FL=1
MRKFLLMMIGFLALMVTTPMMVQAATSNAPPGIEQTMFIPETIQINFDQPEVPAEFLMANICIEAEFPEVSYVAKSTLDSKSNQTFNNSIRNIKGYSMARLCSLISVHII